MKNITLLIVLLLPISFLKGQQSSNVPVIKNRFFINYYPSTLLVGDIAFGLEHLYKKRLAQELSINIKSFSTPVYYFDKGFRLDYLAKYILFEDHQFRLAPFISTMYKDVYFKNKEIDYFYVKFENSNNDRQIYQVLLEDRSRQEYGIGLGFNLNFKLCKQFFIGGDFGVNFIKYKTIYNFKEIIYREFRDHDPGALEVPSTFVAENSGLKVSPLLRLKLSYLINKK